MGRAPKVGNAFFQEGTLVPQRLNETVSFRAVGQGSNMPGEGPHGLNVATFELIQEGIAAVPFRANTIARERGRQVLNLALEVGAIGREKPCNISPSSSAVAKYIQASKSV